MKFIVSHNSRIINSVPSQEAFCAIKKKVENGMLIMT